MGKGEQCRKKNNQDVLQQPGLPIERRDRTRNPRSGADEAKNRDGPVARHETDIVS